MNVDAEILSTILGTETSDALHHPGELTGIIADMLGCFRIVKAINVICYIKKRKGKNHTIIQKGPEKAFIKIQNNFMLKP